MEKLSMMPSARTWLLGLLFVGLLAACDGWSAPPPLPTPVITVQDFPLPNLQWRFTAENYLIVPLHYANGVLITAVYTREGGDYFYYAIDAITGQMLWKYRTVLGYYPSQWEITEDTLLLAGDYRVEAVSLTDGKLLWGVDSRWPAFSVATEANTVFIGFKGWVSAYDLASGQEKWRNDSLSGYAFDVWYDGQTGQLVVLNMSGYEIHKLNSLTGQLLLTIKVGQDSEWGRCGSTQFTDFQFDEGRLVCYGTILDVETGQVIKKFYNTAGRGLYLSTPLIVSDTLYLAENEGGLLAFDLASMTELWTYQPETEARIGANVAIVGSTGYAIASDSTIRAFDLSNGKSLGWLQISDRQVSWGSGSNGAPVTSVASDGIRVFVGIEDEIYAFGP